jgi:DNA-binding MarR family transcriptional regulator
MGLRARVTRRSRTLDELAEALPQRAAALSRLFLARSSVPVSRVEASVLRALSARPRRITMLAAREGVTQPGITRLVDRLEQRGWVTRETDPADGRAVLVTLTPAGQRVFERLRSEYRALVHEEMATLSDEDIHTLARAIEILDRLIHRLEGPAYLSGGSQASRQTAL